MVLQPPLMAQWLNFPGKGVPRLANGKPDLSAPAPKTADGKPDLSGIWKLDRQSMQIPNISDFQIYVGALADRAPFRPESAAAARAARDNQYKDNVEARCIPWAAPMAGGPAVWKLLQEPGLIAILY